VPFYFKFLVDYYLLKASINSAFFIEEYPSRPFSLAISLSSATVCLLKSSEDSAFASSFFSALGAAFLPPFKEISPITISVKD